ncbi:hypothetical protein D3C81_777540 [compost metagenome]
MIRCNHLLDLIKGKTFLFQFVRFNLYVYFLILDALHLNLSNAPYCFNSRNSFILYEPLQLLLICATISHSIDLRIKLLAEEDGLASAFRELGFGDNVTRFLLNLVHVHRHAGFDYTGVCIRCPPGIYACNSINILEFLFKNLAHISHGLLR